MCGYTSVPEDGRTCWVHFYKDHNFVSWFKGDSCKLTVFLRTVELVSDACVSQASCTC